MPEQTDMFEVDHIGRKTALLGLATDQEIIVEVIEEAKRLHSSFARYQVGLVDCEMKRLSASDRSAELTRLWTDTFTSYTNLGSVLERFRPIDDSLESQIRTEAAAERAKAQAQKGDAIDNELNSMLGGMPPLDPPNHEDESEGL